MYEGQQRALARLALKRKELAILYRLTPTTDRLSRQVLRHAARFTAKNDARVSKRWARLAKNKHAAI